MQCCPIPHCLCVRECVCVCVCVCVFVAQWYDLVAEFRSLPKIAFLAIVHHHCNKIVVADDAIEPQLLNLSPYEQYRIVSDSLSSTQEPASQPGSTDQLADKRQVLFLVARAKQLKSDPLTIV